MDTLRLAALGLALLTFASFVWAIRRLFVTTGGLRGGMRAIAVGGALSMALHLAAIAAGHAGPLAALGLVLYGLALALFWSAVGVTAARPLSIAFSTDRPRHLLAVGPYARIRHPFYAAYLLAWIAGTLASGQSWLLLTVAGMGALYVRAARFEESKFAASPLAAEYARYKHRAGMFWPGRGRGPVEASPPAGVEASRSRAGAGGGSDGTPNIGPSPTFP
jgi:protein-S-isoprenylcysteine O-methyltransferase Ste14